MFSFLLCAAFAIGDEIKLECRRNMTAFPQAFVDRLSPRPVTPAGSTGHIVDDSERWGPGIICSETGRELSFRFGTDGFVHCGWKISNEDTYQFARSVMSQDSGWNCRVPMSADRSFYLPVLLPLWGVVESAHVHLNYHLNFVFHVDDGRIMGASVYPMRDKFQFGRVGSIINLHGPVRWFQKNTFLALNGVSHQAPTQVLTEGTAPIGVIRQDTGTWKNSHVRKYERCAVAILTDDFLSFCRPSVVPPCRGADALLRHPLLRMPTQADAGEAISQG